MKIENQNGIISLFTLFTMLFLLMFTINIYFALKDRAQIQKRKALEVKEIYSESYNEIESAKFASNNEVIPIYNADELNVIGTNSYLQIKNKIYQCGIGKSYVLKDNIIVDIDEKLTNNTIGFNDYKLYSQTYYIDKNIYDIYYFKDNNYWKAIAYQDFSVSNNIINKETSYTEKIFSIINDYNWRANNYNFMILWTDENGMLTNYDMKAQYIINKITNIEEIEVFRKHVNEIDRAKGKYYIFVGIGNSI